MLNLVYLFVRDLPENPSQLVQSYAQSRLKSFPHDLLPAFLSQWLIPIVAIGAEMVCKGLRRINTFFDDFSSYKPVEGLFELVFRRVVAFLSLYLSELFLKFLTIFLVSLPLISLVELVAQVFKGEEFDTFVEIYHRRAGQAFERFLQQLSWKVPQICVNELFQSDCRLALQIFHKHKGDLNVITKPLEVFRKKPTLCSLFALKVFLDLSKFADLF